PRCAYLLHHLPLTLSPFFLCLFFSFSSLSPLFLLFFFTRPAPTLFSTLSLHDALPISLPSATSLSSTTSPKLLPSANNSKWRCEIGSTRLNSSHVSISYAVFCLKKKKNNNNNNNRTYT